MIYVVIPSWRQSEVIRVRMTDVPVQVLHKLRSGGRVHAQVNSGAEAQDEIYLCNWEAE
jgi:hypothetical protein